MSIADATRPPVDARPVDVCAVDAVPRGGGVAALVHGRQVALLREDDGTLHALDNRDPWTGAHVLSRGIVGAHGGRPTVASPLRKQRFDLTSGACLEDPVVRVAVHVARVRDGRVLVQLADLPAATPEMRS